MLCLCCVCFVTKCCSSGTKAPWPLVPALVAGCSSRHLTWLWARVCISFDLGRIHDSQWWLCEFYICLLLAAGGTLIHKASYKKPQPMTVFECICTWRMCPWMDSCCASCSGCTSHVAQAALTPSLLFAESQHILATRLVSWAVSILR